MFIPGSFRMTEQEEITRFMQAHPFAIIVSHSDAGFAATHTPVELESDAEGRPLIRTHIARANQQWKALEAGAEAMVIFQGPHAYISSSWYDHVNVPTWNYLAVHVYGKVRILSQEEALNMLHRLVSRYEQQPGHRFAIDQMSPEDLHAHLQALVAFEITVDRVDAKAKLSQNRDLHNYDRIIDALAKREDADSRQIREEMLKRRDRIK